MSFGFYHTIAIIVREEDPKESHLRVMTRDACLVIGNEPCCRSSWPVAKSASLPPYRYTRACDWCITCPRARKTVGNSPLYLIPQWSMYALSILENDKIDYRAQIILHNNKRI